MKTLLSLLGLFILNSLNNSSLACLESEIQKEIEASAQLVYKACVTPQESVEERSQALKRIKDLLQTEEGIKLGYSQPSFVYQALLVNYLYEKPGTLPESLIKMMEERPHFNAPLIHSFLLHMVAKLATSDMRFFFWSRSQLAKIIQEQAREIFSDIAKQRSPNVGFILKSACRNQLFDDNAPIIPSDYYEMAGGFNHGAFYRQSGLWKILSSYDIRKLAFQKDVTFFQNSLYFEIGALAYDPQGEIKSILERHQIPSSDIRRLGRESDVEGDWVLFYAPGKMRAIMIDMQPLQKNNIPRKK